MSDKTREIVHKFINYLEEKRFEDWYRLLNSDGRFIVIGENKTSGIYNGVEDVFKRLVPQYSIFKVPPKITFSEILVDGDKAFLRASGHGEGVFGHYEQPYYGFYLRVEGDGLAEVIEFMDPTQVEIACFGKKLVPAEPPLESA